MSELERHYQRLCRVGQGEIWKRAFLGLSILLWGGVIGAVLAGPGWTAAVEAATLLAFVLLLASGAVQRAEAEAISNIREDFKEDILDSIELEMEDENREEFSLAEISSFWDKLKPSGDGDQ